MKNLLLTMLLGFMTLGMLQASQSGLIKETTRGNSIEVTLLNDGRINLFSHESEIIPATVPQDPLESYTRTHVSYYISKGEAKLIEIHCGNYKKVLSTHLADDEELTRKIGQKGFRFEDLQTIISQYNKN